MTNIRREIDTNEKEAGLVLLNIGLPRNINVLGLDIVGRRAVGALEVAGRALSLLLLLHALLGAVEATAVGTLCDRRHLGHGLLLLLSLLLHFSIDLHLSSFDHTNQRCENEVLCYMLHACMK